MRLAVTNYPASVIDPQQPPLSSRAVVLIGVVAVVLAVPFGRWLGLRPPILALLIATVAVMTVGVAVRTAQAERRDDADE